MSIKYFSNSTFALHFSIFWCSRIHKKPAFKRAKKSTTVEGTVIWRFLLFVIILLLLNFMKEKCLKLCFVLTTCRLVLGYEAMSHVLLPLIGVLPTTDGYYMMSLNMPNYTNMCSISKNGQSKVLKYTCWINRFFFSILNAKIK